MNPHLQFQEELEDENPSRNQLVISDNYPNPSKQGLNYSS